MTMKPASAARASRSCLLTISIRSGALNIRDKRWGRSGTFNTEAEMLAFCLGVTERHQYFSAISQKSWRIGATVLTTFV
jgi:hypothetical protein